MEKRVLDASHNQNPCTLNSKRNHTICFWASTQYVRGHPKQDFSKGPLQFPNLVPFGDELQKAVMQNLFGVLAPYTLSPHPKSMCIVSFQVECSLVNHYTFWLLWHHFLNQRMHGPECTLGSCTGNCMK